MIRDFFHQLLVRGENFLNCFKEGNNKDVLNEDNNNNDKNNKKNVSKIYKIFWQVSNNNKDKPQTVDVAVGDDESPKSIFLRIFKFRKNSGLQDEEAYPQEGAIDKIVHGFQREALIATKEIVASSCSSLFAVFFSHPFDVIKSQYQMLRYPRTIHAPFFRRRKFIYVIRNIYMTKGLKRFYKNLWKSQQESAFHVFSVFWTYHRMRQIFEENFQIRNEDVTNFIAGFFSPTIPALILYPYHNFLERKEIKQKISRRHGPPVAEGFVKQLKHWRPLYRGGFAMFMHMSILYGFRFMFFHKILDQLAHLKTTNDKATDTNPYVTEVDSIVNYSNGELLLAGASAAILGDILAHPLDVIRSRLAMNTLMRQQYRYDDTCRKFYHCAKLILKNERFGAFYAGITPCIIRSTVNTALTFSAYEKMRDWLRPFFPT